ncbi:unnamed protein product, partial [Rotaria sordida]
MVVNGEKNLLCSEDVIYYATTSGTTAKIKLLPITETTIKNISTAIRLASYVIWRSLPSSSVPSPEQRPFSLIGDTIQFYCGQKLPLINGLLYGASEGFFGYIASIHTDEYLPLPTHAFYEFIKEEDVQQAQPKTLLISEIEPGHRYELVCTTEAGLVRYRLGDMVNCTRFLCQADDLVRLPQEPVEIPRIPVISVAYRVGNLLDVYGEKTNEQHVMNALLQTMRQWKEQGIHVDLDEFTSYPRLDVFPPRYVIFMELIEKQGHKLDAQQLRFLQSTISSDVEQQLCKANQEYAATRRGTKLGALDCILVRSGTFSTFLK